MDGLKATYEKGLIIIKLKLIYIYRHTYARIIYL